PRAEPGAAEPVVLSAASGGGGAGAGTPPAAPPRCSVIVPTRGDRARLAGLFDALARQTLPRDQWDLLLAADRTSLDQDLAPRLVALGGRLVEARGGPGAARNAGAAAARGAWLAFTE